MTKTRFFFFFKYHPHLEHLKKKFQDVGKLIFLLMIFAFFKSKEISLISFCYIENIPDRDITTFTLLYLNIYLDILCLYFIFDCKKYNLLIDLISISIYFF